MILCKCIDKYRDTTGTITGYMLLDLNGQRLQVAPNHLKTLIKNKQVAVSNLTLTRDNRLVDAAEDKLESIPHSKLLLNSIRGKRHIEARNVNIIKKICNGLDVDFENDADHLKLEVGKHIYTTTFDTTLIHGFTLTIKVENTSSDPRVHIELSTAESHWEAGGYENDRDVAEWLWSINNFLSSCMFHKDYYKDNITMFILAMNDYHKATVADIPLTSLHVVYAKRMGIYKEYLKHVASVRDMLGTDKRIISILAAATDKLSAAVSEQLKKNARVLIADCILFMSLTNTPVDMLEPEALRIYYVKQYQTLF